MAKSFLHGMYDLMKSRQEQYLGKHTINEITRMPRNNVYDKLDLVIKIMTHASHLRIERHTLIDSANESNPVTVLQLLTLATTYATNNKIVGNNLMKLLNHISGDIIKFNDGPIDMDVIELYLNNEIIRDETLIDVSKSNKYWEFKGDSGAKYSGTTRDLVSIKYDQAIDMLKGTCVIEGHEEYRDFLLDNSKLVSMGYIKQNGQLGLIRSYIAYVASGNEDNKFYQVFCKYKEQNKSEEEKNQGGITITNDNKAKNDVEMKF